MSTKMQFDELANGVFACAIELRRHPGPGLPKTACAQCLPHELTRNEIAAPLQLALPVKYNAARLDGGYRIDMLVDNQLIVELQSVDERKTIYEVRLLTDMQLAGVKFG